MTHSDLGIWAGFIIVQVSATLLRHIEVVDRHHRRRDLSEGTREVDAIHFLYRIRQLFLVQRAYSLDHYPNL